MPDCDTCQSLVDVAEEFKNSETCKELDSCKDCTPSMHCTCFPGDAIVTRIVDNGGRCQQPIAMADLMVGDKVLVGPGGQFSEVFMFSHRLPGAEATFVEIHTAASGTPLAITSGHYLYRYMAGARGAARQLVEARRVRVGDNVTLGASGKAAPVVAVRSVRKKGLYNPHTLHGDIVVGGVLASSYTAAFSPTLAHVVLAPLRALYRAGVDIFKVDVGAALDALPAWWTRRFRAA